MGQLLSMGSCPFCGSGTNTACFATYSDGYHCYTCGKHRQGNASEYAYRPTKEVTKVNMPTFTTDINKFSPGVLQWLYKYYVMDKLIKKYSIGYVYENNEESLIYNVVIKNKIEFWQQRFFPSKRFKTGGDKNTLFTTSNTPTNIIVLVEDFLSAIRIAEHTNILCLWGTSLNKQMLAYLKFLSISNILIWLDPDEAGQTASKVIVKQLTKALSELSLQQAFSIRESRMVSIVQADKQPKEYCDTEIKQILGEYS